jgi:predicted deacylase
VPPRGASHPKRRTNRKPRPTATSRGKKGGSASQSFAHALMSRVVRHVDVLLDLHTASFGRVNSLYVRADMRDARTHRLALLQRPQIIVHNSGPDGSLRGACAALGKPCITIEIGDPQVIDPALTESALRGVRNTLQHLKMVAVAEEGARGGAGHGGAGGGGHGGAGAPPVVVSRSFWLFSQAAGILTVKPAVAAWVRRGEVVAELHSVWGDLVDRVVAAHDGVVVGKSTNPVCASGDRILHLGVCEQSFEAKADDGHQ